MDLKDKMKPGFYREQQIDALKKFEYISFSKIRLILESKRAFFRHYKHGEVAEPTKEMTFGQIIHAAALEPFKFRDRYRVMPYFEAPTAEGKMSPNSAGAKAKRKEWLDAQRKDAMIVTQDQMDGIITMVDNILFHKDARRLLSGGKSEGWLYVFDEHHGTWLLARPDFLTNDLITVELKTTSKPLTRKAWAREVFNMGYHIQLAHNHRAVRIHHNLPEDHRKGAWVVVQNRPPFDVAVFTASENMMIAGEDKAFRGYNEISEMLEKDPDLEKPELWHGKQLQAEEVDLEPWMIDHDPDHLELNQMNQP